MCEEMITKIYLWREENATIRTDNYLEIDDSKKKKVETIPENMQKANATFAFEAIIWLYNELKLLLLNKRWIRYVCCSYSTSQTTLIWNYNNEVEKTFILKQELSFPCFSLKKFLQSQLEIIMLAGGRLWKKSTFNFCFSNIAPGTWEEQQNLICWEIKTGNLFILT